MSRRNRQDNLNGVQLFPFIAVLLCTIGSLLVVLIGVAESARKRGAEEAAAQQAAARAAAAAHAEQAKSENAAARRDIAQFASYKSQLDAIHGKAADQLRQDQSRLSHLEDHMRRLREQLEAFKVAAAELNAREDEHLDDREQAQREIERLEQLIAEARKTIDELKADVKSRVKSYAIVPYQGRRGTVRRPIYIECLGDEVILQPEGVRLTIDDFQPPIGPGNPLVAAIRAAREHIARNDPGAPTGKGTEPYPLIIVRPDGVRFYYLVREAIQSWDSEFGYELVEADWELKYAPADPQLAEVEFQAVELSRNRLRALAAAAPKAFGAYRYGGGGGSGYGFGEAGFSGGGGGNEGEGEGRGGDGDGFQDETDDYRLAVASEGGTGNRRMASRPGSERAVAVVDSGETQDGQNDGIASENQSVGGSVHDKAGTSGAYGSAGSAGKPNGKAEGIPAGVAGGSLKQPNSRSTAASGKRGRGAGQSQQQPSADDSQQLSDGRPRGAYTGDDPERELDAMASDAATDQTVSRAGRRGAVKARGENWALRNANPGMIPIRRSIQVVVRGDALVILSEASSTNASTAGGHEFPFADSPTVAYEELLNAVDSRIDNWGMAGQGLYWRPVVELKVDADGDQRVGDLMHLLRHSGVEVRAASVAQQNEGGVRGTSR